MVSVPQHGAHRRRTVTCESCNLFPDDSRAMHLTTGGAAQLNESLYFHETDNETAKKIEKLGFDERFSKDIYGDGLYFTPHACKALHYAPAHSATPPQSL